MENNQEMLATIAKLEKTNRRQLIMSTVQCVATVLTAVCCLVIMIFALNTLSQVQPLVSHAEDMAQQANTVLTNLEEVTTELAQADLSSMVADVDGLVSSSQVAVEEALNKINTIDIATLNKAIADLSAVVEPLARVTNIFG